MLAQKEVDKEYDVIIIGASAAGLTAAIYTSRGALKTLVIGKVLGGQMSETPEVENYPGFESISGMDLTKRMEAQARKFGATIIEDEVTEINQEGDQFKVKSLVYGEFTSKALILATGRSHRKLNAKGEDKFAGKGVSYCVECDALFFKDKVVGVVGGGNSAFTAAEYLSKIASKVYLIHRRNEFRAEEIIVRRVKQIENVEIITPYIVEEMYGGNVLEGIKIRNRETNEIKDIKLNGIFIEIGTVPNTAFLGDFVELNEYGEIKVDRLMRTSREGVFAAGDVTDNRDKQIAVAVGEGCIAGLSAKEYLYDGERKGKWTLLGKQN